jgi:hypothetical protein
MDVIGIASCSSGFEFLLARVIRLGFGVVACCSTMAAPAAASSIANECIDCSSNKRSFVAADVDGGGREVAERARLRVIAVLVLMNMYAHANASEKNTNKTKYL